jgi:ketosteroid isomerase-like protein
MLADINADKIKELSEAIKNIDLKDKSDVKEFVKNYTALIYNHQMDGLIYDFYEENVEVLKENRIRLKGIEAVVQDKQVLLAAFPDLKVKIENIIVSEDGDDGFKIFRRMRYEGTNSGYTKFGPPTGKSLGNSCLGLSMFYMDKKSGSWKITHEMDMRSAEWMEKTMTND